MCEIGPYKGTDPVLPAISPFTLLLQDKGFAVYKLEQMPPKASGLGAVRLGIHLAVDRGASSRVPSLGEGCEGFTARYYQAG